MALISKAQGEQCSIVTMYKVINDGWSVGLNPDNKQKRTGANKGTWEPWMSSKNPYAVGRGITYSLASILGQGKFNDHIIEQSKFLTLLQNL